MKKILMSLMAIGLVVGLVGAGTMAYFSDTETSTGNTFTAGTLDIALGTSSWSADFDNMKPGDTVTFTLPVNNEGSLPLNYTVTTTLSGTLAGGVNPCTQVTAPTSGSLDVGGSVNIVVSITMPSAADNEYQGQSGILTVTINAVQQ